MANLITGRNSKKPPKTEIVGLPVEKKERPSRNQRVSPSLTKIAKRALHVTDDQLRTYLPREFDLQLVECYLSGAATFKDVAAMMEVSPSTVSKAMRDPLICAWVSQQLHQVIPMRLGLIGVALFQRACSGDTRAAELLLKRYGQLINRNFNVNVNATDYSKMTDKDLDTLIGHHGTQEENRVPPGEGGEGAAS